MLPERRKLQQQTDIYVTTCWPFVRGVRRMTLEYIQAFTN